MICAINVMSVSLTGEILFTKIVRRKTFITLRIPPRRTAGWLTIGATVIFY
jgi:hypothetical protein